MQKHAKIINEQTKQCDVGTGTNTAFYKSIGMTEMEVEQGYDGQWYVAGYAPKQPLEEAKADALTRIDTATSSAILAGFSYDVDGESLHFSYDSFDQQNFVDSASVATLSLSGQQGLPTFVTWNAYRNYTPETGGELVRLDFTPQTFLALYMQGALAHKGLQMEIGGQRKAAIEAAESAEAVQALLERWGL